MAQFRQILLYTPVIYLLGNMQSHKKTTITDQQLQNKNIGRLHEFDYSDKHVVYATPRLQY